MELICCSIVFLLFLDSLEPILLPKTGFLGLRWQMSFSVLCSAFSYILCALIFLKVIKYKIISNIFFELYLKKINFFENSLSLNEFKTKLPDAIKRLHNPTKIGTKYLIHMSIVSFLVNLVSLYLFHGIKKHDHTHSHKPKSQQVNSSNHTYHKIDQSNSFHLHKCSHSHSKSHSHQKYNNSVHSKKDGRIFHNGYLK